MIRPRIKVPPKLRANGGQPPPPKRRLPFKLPRLTHRSAAIGATAAPALVALIGVQVFGDPSAAGPRRILSLQPGDAGATAPRVSLSDAAIDGSDLNNLGLNDSVSGSGTVGDIDSDGQLHVSVVDSADSGSPAASPLPPAPLAGFTERNANGLLPIIAANGRTPAQAYARPFTRQADKPMISVIIGGLGFNARATQQAIDELPPEVTLSFVPYAQDLQTWIDRARAAGHEVMLELPMEPFDPDADDTGPQTLLASAPAAQNVTRLEQLLGKAAGYFGVTNYQGARFATSSSAAQPVVQQLRRRGLAFLTSGLGQRTALALAAQSAGLSSASADRIIDVRREADAIDDQLLNLEALALQNQSAIGAGFAYPVTIEQVGRWARDVSTRGYQLAPASAVLNARAARR